MFVNVWNDTRHSFLLPSHAQWSAVLRHALLRGRMVLALAPPRSPMGFALRADPKSSTGSARAFTCLIAVFPIRTLHTLKAAGGLPLNDPLPGPCQTVPAAVGEGHLQSESTEGRGLQLEVCVSTVSPTTHMHSDESGYVRISEVNSGSF